MIIRLGYVAMTLNLQDSSPSGTVTVTAYNKLPNEEAQHHRLKKLTEKNLENTRRILLYNKAMGIEVYRFTSKLVPLATHPLIDRWDYLAEFSEEFKRIGKLVKENDFRVSAHPDHFTIINSPSWDVVKDAVKDLDYHVKVYEAMGLDDYKYKLVLHVGGLYKDKELSLERFKRNFINLPDRIRKRIIIENDDKSFSAHDVLCLCKELKVPMVLDVHHHKCVNDGEKLEDMLEDIFNTWNGEAFPPKIHFSSPKSEKDFRSHADNIDINEFLEFLDIARKQGRDFDVMLEAKNKDSALLKLSEDLKSVTGLKRISNGKFEIL